VTFKKNVPKILYHGILTEKRQIWGNRYGVMLGRADIVYAWGSWDRAWRWAYKQWWDFGYKPTAIIKFSVSKKYVNMLDTMLGKEYLVEINILPEQIRDVFMIDLEKP
jgi:hypothetical protein